MWPGLLLFVLIVAFAIFLRTGWRPSWPAKQAAEETSTPSDKNDGHASNNTHDTAPQKKGGSAVGSILGWTLGAILLLVGIIWVHGVWVQANARATQQAEYIRTHPTAPPAAEQTTRHVIAQCVMPCHLPVGPNNDIVWDDGNTIIITFNGLEPQEYTNQPGVLVGARKFNAGEAQFVSPAGKPLLVQILSR